MKRIKNVIVSTHDSLAPIKGGGALRTLKAAIEFKKRGYNVIIIAPTDHIGELYGIKVHWLHPPRKQRSQILSSLKFNIRLFRKFLQFIWKTDLIFIHNTISAATIPFLKLIFRFKFVLDITDIHAEYLPVGKRNIFEGFLTPTLLMIEYFIIRNADKIVVVTNEMKKHLIKKGIDEGKMIVVYDGADTDSIPCDKEKGADKGVIHFGTIDRQHGVEYLVKAIPYVLEKNPDVKFYFVGGGRELENVRKLAKSLGVFGNCIFTDYLPHEEAVKFLRRANIGVIPRPDNLPNRIVTTLKIYEYWASKTAVVSSKLSGISEIAKDFKNVLFFKPGDSEDLANKINLLISDKSLMNKLQEEGRRSVMKYSWDKIIKRIVDFAVSG